MTKSDLGIVAIYQNEEGELEEIITRNESAFHARKMEQSKYLEEHGYRLVFCVMTNNEEIFYKKRLEAGVLMLKCYTAKHNDWLQEHIGFYSDDVLSATQKCMQDVEETLMNKVAIRCSSLILRDIDITDELAIQCYDWREKKMSCV